MAIVADRLDSDVLTDLSDNYDMKVCLALCVQSVKPCNNCVRALMMVEFSMPRESELHTGVWE